MTRHARATAAAVVALAVMVAGAGYSILRPETYRSEGTLVVAATPEDPYVRSVLLDGFQRSGTAGTYVELFTSEEVRRAAGVTGVDVSVEALPDTRALELTATGPAGRVQDAVAALQGLAGEPLTAIDDAWEVQVLAGPTEPVPAGPSVPMILAATVLLAALAFLVTWEVLTELGHRLGARRRRRAGLPWPRHGVRRRREAVGA